MGAALSRRRRIAGLLLAIAGLPLLTAAARTADLELGAAVLLFLAAVVGIALTGGIGPALAGALGGSALLNYYFTPPLRRLAIGATEDLWALVVFVVVAVAVSAVVDLAARRTRQADTLAALAGAVLRGGDPLDALLHRLRELFGLTSVTLLERTPTGWRAAASAGSRAAGGAEFPADDDHLLVLHGPRLRAADRRVVGAFAAQAAVALRQRRLAAAAEGDLARTALLRAVSHDLRTPLAAAKAAVDGLRSPGVDFGAEDRAELLATAGESLDRLAALVANLLDMSRLEAGTLGMSPVELGLEEVLPRALDEAGGRVSVRLPDDLPAVHADPGLLERVVVNLVANALRFSPADRPPEITGQVRDGRVELRVIDHGPGIPEADRDLMFRPFQRLGDRDNHAGVGLGLALSRGLTEAMGGSLLPEATPGGGLTMVVALPRKNGPIPNKPAAGET
jgi:two-component system sensor histidine kinase KdpD